MTEKLGALAGASGTNEPVAQHGIVQQPGDGLRQRLGIVGRTQQPVDLGINQFGDAGDRSGDDGHALVQRLNQHVRDAVAVATLR
jgi:hypothetical protein